MKDMNDVSIRLRAELDQWFIGQCNNNYAEYYLYYLETTPEHDGGILICADQPANKDYKLVNGRIGPGNTKEQHFNRLYHICRTLPILEV
jgi:hypothetical protein